MFCGCQRGRDCQTSAVYGCLSDFSRLRALARQRPDLATLDLVLLDIPIPEGDHDQRRWHLGYSYSQVFPSKFCSNCVDFLSKFYSM